MLSTTRIATFLTKNCRFSQIKLSYFTVVTAVGKIQCEECLAKHGKIRIYKLVKTNARQNGHNKKHSNQKAYSIVCKCVQAHVYLCFIQSLKCHLVCTFIFFVWKMCLFATEIARQSYWPNLVQGSKSLKGTGPQHTERTVCHKIWLRKCSRYEGIQRTKHSLSSELQRYGKAY